MTPGDKWPQGTLRLAGGASRVPRQGAPRWPDLHLGLLHRDRQWTLWLTVAPAKMERERIGHNAIAVDWSGETLLASGDAAGKRTQVANPLALDRQGPYRRTATRR